MAVARWNTPGTASSALTITASLASGSASAFVVYDNSTNLDLYANVLVNLGSITPVAGGSISLAVFSNQGTTVPDNTALQGGGDIYTIPLTTTASAKVATIPMIRLYPFICQLAVINNTGVALAASGNTLILRPFNEQVV